MKRNEPKVADTTFWIEGRIKELRGRFLDYVKLAQEDRDHISKMKWRFLPNSSLPVPLGTLIEFRTGRYAVVLGPLVLIDGKYALFGRFPEGTCKVNVIDEEAWFYEMIDLIEPRDLDYNLCLHRFLTR